MTLTEYIEAVNNELEKTEMPSLVSFCVIEGLLTTEQIAFGISMTCKLMFEAPIPIVPPSEIAEIIYGDTKKLYLAFVEHLKECPNCKDKSHSTDKVN